MIAYLPYTFLAFITPMVSLFYGITGLTMTRMDKVEVQKVRVRREREKKLMMKFRDQFLIRMTSLRERFYPPYTC